MRVIAAILAAGSGVRLGREVPKQFLKIAGRTVLGHTLETFQSVDEVDEIVVVTSADMVERVRIIAKTSGADKVIQVVVGGKTRNDSTKAALDAIADTDAKILIHDAVRPFVSHSP